MTDKTYECRVYGEKTVRVNAESKGEALRRATADTNTGELEPWVEGDPEVVEGDGDE